MRFYKLIIFINLILIILANPTWSKDYNVSIGILPDIKGVFIASSHRAFIKSKNINYTLAPLTPYYVSVNSNSEILFADTKNLIASSKEELFIESDNINSQVPLLYAEGKWYRGKLKIFINSSNNLTVVNILPLEEYLYGVIAGEMPYTWPLEALKAQSVAARTYAIANIGAYKSKGFDMYATPQSQVYLGVLGEKASTTQAVNETKGLIMTYNGKVINAYYHSTSGGITENGFDSFDSQPYLRAVVDFDQRSPKYLWFTNFTVNELNEIFIKNNILVGDILKITPTKFSQTGRVKELNIEGTQSTYTISGNKFRQILKLNSTFFNIGALSSDFKLIQDKEATPYIFQIAGRGWGHGLGMSQWGAYQMALNGKNFREILTYYYKGIKIEKIYN